MDFDPAALGLIDDGSKIEVNINHVQPGRMEEAIAAFQEAFADYKPEGFKIIYACTDLANNRLIWIHRYDKDFDLANRFYLGKYPKIPMCLWAGSRYDVLAASPEELPV